MSPAKTKAKPETSLVAAAVVAARVRGAGGRIIVALAMAPDGTVLDIDNAVDLENAWARAAELVTLAGVKDAVPAAVSLDTGGARVMLADETVTLDL